jgi:hypothetical protein
MDLLKTINEKNEDLAISLITPEKAAVLTPKKNTPLILACYKNMTKVALALIETSNSNPGQVNELGNTALIVACSNKMTEVALALIETRNSNPNHVNRTSATALMLACENKMTEVALKLIVDGNSNPGHVNATNQTTALILACNNKMTEVALALIETRNSNPEQVNALGNTALIWACENKMTEVALALIKTGNSNPEIIPYNNKSALNKTINNNMKEVFAAITAKLNELNTRISKLQIIDIYSGIDMTGYDFLYNNELKEKQPFIIEEASGRCASNYKNIEYELFYECKEPYSESNKTNNSPIYIKLYGSGGQILLCEKPDWFNEIGASIKIVKAVKQGLLEQIVSHLSVGRRVMSADHCNLEKPITYYKLFKTELDGIGINQRTNGGKGTDISRLSAFAIKTAKTKKAKAKTKKAKTKIQHYKKSRKQRF